MHFYILGDVTKTNAFKLRIPRESAASSFRDCRAVYIQICATKSRFNLYNSKVIDGLVVKESRNHQYKKLF